MKHFKFSSEDKLQNIIEVSFYSAPSGNVWELNSCNLAKLYYWQYQWEMNPLSANRNPWYQRLEKIAAVTALRSYESSQVSWSVIDAQK